MLKFYSRLMDGFFVVGHRFEFYWYHVWNNEDTRQSERERETLKEKKNEFDLQWWDIADLQVHRVFHLVEEVFHNNEMFVYYS